MGISSTVLWAAILCLAAIGVVIGVVVMLKKLKAKGIAITDITKISTLTNTYYVEAPFAAIAAPDAAFNVRILPAEDGICKVKCKGSRKLSHVVTIEDDVLFVRREDKRKWYDRLGLQLEGAEIVFSLPVGRYRMLQVATPCGNIEIAKPFTFSEVELSSMDGEIRLLAAVEEVAGIKTSSGAVTVSGCAPRILNIQTRAGAVSVDSIEAETKLNVNTTSGDITMTDIRCRKAVAETAGGKIFLSNLVASAKLRIRTGAGDVELKACDSESIKIRTVAGDISAVLRSHKTFDCKTTAGDIKVPEGTTGGLCKIRTGSGDAVVKIDYSGAFR